MFNQKLFIVLVALSMGQTAFAAKLYVNTNGQNGDCSRSQPCKSIQTAINQAQAGDRIKIASGEYFENLTIPAGKDGLSLSGAGMNKTFIIATDGPVRKFAPANVAAEIILDIFARDVSIKNLSLKHTNGIATKRDIGIFVRPPAINSEIEKVKVVRMRTGENLEPTVPGSRGLLVFRATGTEVEESIFKGNYEDHIHLPTSSSSIEDNIVDGATRIGIVIIQENQDSLSINNKIESNTVTNSGSDGIQVQGDENKIEHNLVMNNAGYGIHFCGINSNPACVAPGHTASANFNRSENNESIGNGLGGIADFGENNQ
ncbi:MAG: pectinesterase family protein [Gammaproteobacteria bacterium]|nr:pectinesterase family protein [Gammaproteobacteria bacterium]MDH5727667.1 pectinesterase family protein [Gammaproteobacteria bacterium]